MRKTLFALGGILAVLFVLLSLLDSRGDYVAEKMIWKVNQGLYNASLAPEAVPDNVYEQIASQYQQIIRDFPGSNLVPLAYIFLGRVYILKKDYGTARTELTHVLKKYPANEAICAEAVSVIGNSYELEGNWPEALKIYEKIKVDYPLTDLGLNAPLYIANYYVQNGHSVNAQNAFNDAIVYYTEISSKHPNSEIEYKSLQLLSNCYLMQKRWDEAVKVMGDILLKYPMTKMAMPLIQSINAVTLTHIKNFDIAIAIYQNFIEKNPRNPLDKTLQEMIAAFDELKKKNVNTATKDS